MSALTCHGLLGLSVIEIGRSVETTRDDEVGLPAPLVRLRRGWVVFLGLVHGAVSLPLEMVRERLRAGKWDPDVVARQRRLAFAFSCLDTSLTLVLSHGQCTPVPVCVS